jgi:hypothetical protein
MNLKIRLAVLMAAVLIAPAAAQSSLEAFSASGGARFDAALMGISGGQFRPTASMRDAQSPRPSPAMVDGWENEMKRTAVVVEAAGVSAATAGPLVEFDLASTLNTHLKTGLRYQLNGRTVWFSGAFDRAQKPYVSVLVDGVTARYYDVKALLNQDQRLTINGQPYTLSLSPNIFHKMKSTINLRADNGRDSARFSVQDMLDAVGSVGQPLNLGGVPYRFYYADGLNGGTSDPTARMFVFIAGNSKDFHVFLVPESSVPSDRLGVYPMLNNARVGLVSRGGRLQVYENP